MRDPIVSIDLQRSLEWQITYMSHWYDKCIWHNIGPYSDAAAVPVLVMETFQVRQYNWALVDMVHGHQHSPDARPRTEMPLNADHAEPRYNIRSPLRAGAWRQRPSRRPGSKALLINIICSHRATPDLSADTPHVSYISISTTFLQFLR